MKRTATQKGIDWKDLADWLINYLCERDSPLEVVELLHDYGLTAEQLIEMKFDAADVYHVSPAGKDEPGKTNLQLMKENHIECDWDSLEKLRQAYNAKCEEIGEYNEQIYDMDDFDDYFDGLSFGEIQDRLDDNFNNRDSYFKEGDCGMISGDYLDELMNNEILAAVIADMK